MLRIANYFAAFAVSISCATNVIAQLNPRTQLNPNSQLNSNRQSNPPATERMLLQVREGDWILQAAALEYLSSHRVAAAIEPIQVIVKDENILPWLRGRALVALARIQRNDARDQVLAFAKHEDTAVRAAAAESIEYLDQLEGVEELTSLLEDSEKVVRFRALTTYAQRRRAIAWETVDSMTGSIDLTGATSEPNGGLIIQAAARALGRVGNETAVTRLQTMVANDEMLMPVVRGIQGIPDAKLIEVLLQGLKRLDPEDDRFATCLNALQKHEQAHLLAALKENLGSGRTDMVRTVALITSQMTPAPELGEPLGIAASQTDDVATIKAVLVALGPVPIKPDQHHELFTGYLQHADEDVRILSIRCLAHCKNGNLFSELKPRIDDESPFVVEAALGALLRTKVDDAPQGEIVNYLKPALMSDDPSVQSLAYELLAQVGTAEDFAPAMNLLSERLRSSDENIRNATAVALGKFAPEDRIGEVVRSQGYLARWMVLGTFLNDKENTGFKRVYPPETKIDFAAKYTAKYIWVLDGQVRDKGDLEREIGWSEAEVEQTDGKLIIPTLVPPPAAFAVAYLVSDFQVDSEQEVILNVDGDDAFRVWVNDQKVADQVAPYKHRSECVVAQKGIKIKLRQGANRVLVKSANIDHHWWLRLRLTNVAGEPLEVTHAD